MSSHHQCLILEMAFQVLLFLGMDRSALMLGRVGMVKGSRGWYLIHLVEEIINEVTGFSSLS